MNDKNSGQLVIISGPSGVGKSTICDEVVKRLDDAHLSISATTRPKAGDEIDGRHYWFLTTEEFQKRLADDAFVEYAEVFGNFYGTPKDQIDSAIASGKIVILEIDVQGALQVKKKFPDTKMIFIVPPKAGDLQNRINDRGRDAQAEIEKRLNMASSEIASAWQHYKHLVINDDLNTAVEEVIQIIKNKPDGE
ncbi:MAG: guanylate kinase [Anaerohalosphaeraceae bacterium]|nr:guanylate kinase [Anaerohalosphaeraceae bacterium]